MTPDLGRVGRQAAALSAYVALGDSISIDEYAGGPGRGGPSLLVRNQDGDFPEWRGRDLHFGAPDLRWALLASDGGTTGAVLDVQLPRLQSLGFAPSLVTLTVGGNDLLTCYGDTVAANRVIRQVQRRSAEILDRVYSVSPGAAVIVGTVYDPSDGTADTGRVGLPPWPDVVSVLGELNAVLTETAQRYGAGVADIHGEFLGHGLSRGDPGQASARPADRDLWYCSLIEPNAWGASGVRAAFWKALAAMRPAA